nr:hypothetical protein [Clostridia bacterium]
IAMNQTGDNGPVAEPHSAIYVNNQAVEYVAERNVVNMWNSLSNRIYTTEEYAEYHVSTLPASIGNTYYSSVEQALKAAVDGNIICLHNDATVEDPSAHLAEGLYAIEDPDGNYIIYSEESNEVTVSFDGKEVTTNIGGVIAAADFPADPSKDNFVFKGWADEDGNEVTAATKFYADATVTSQWVPVIESEEDGDIIVDEPEHDVEVNEKLDVPSGSDVDKNDLIESASNLEVGSDAIQNAAVNSVDEIMDDVDTKDDMDYIVKPTIDVDLQSYSESTDEEGNVDKEIVYDVTPKYEVYEIETGTNDIPEDAKPVAEGKLNVTEPVMVRIEIPEGYAAEGETVFITHEKDNGEIYIYDLEVQLDAATGKLYVEFLNENGFSLIIINTQPTSYPAKIVRTRNTAYFKSLANAVSNVNNGETIELTSENSENITVDGVVSFNIKGEFTGNITVARGLEAKTRETANGLEVVVDIYHAPMVPLFFGTTVRVYDAANGTITPNGIPMIIGGMTKTFKFIPDEGFEVADVIVNGQSIGAAESYTIDGWQGYVTLTAVFEEIAESEEIEP